YRANPCAIGANGRSPTASRTEPGGASERRCRRVVEIPGRSNPTRPGLSDQERKFRQEPNFQSQLRDEVLMVLFYPRRAVLLLPVLCFLAGSAVAQAPPAPSQVPAQPTPAPPPAPLPAAQNLMVMVVDVQALLQNSKAAKMVRSQIEQKRGEYT